MGPLIISARVCMDPTYDSYVKFGSAIRFIQNCDDIYKASILMECSV